MQRVLDEFEPRQRAGGNGLVGIDDEHVGERRHRLILRGHLLDTEFDGRKLGFAGVTRELIELVLQHVSAAGKLVLRDQRALALDLENLGENLGEGVEFPGQARDLVQRGGVRGTLHRLIDHVFQAGFGVQGGFAVIFLAGHDIIAGQTTVRDQLAVDIARQIGFRHAFSVRGHTGRNPLEAEIGKTHADGRDREHDGKAEHDFSAKPQGWKLRCERLQPGTLRRSHLDLPFSWHKEAAHQTRASPTPGR